MSCQKKRNLSKEDKNAVIGGMLCLVATPIGNLSDISERALKVLEEVDFVAAEDTRNSGSMLAHFGISKPMISYFEHNKRERGEAIAARLEAGESCALITDAGTPAISDPGEDLVRLCSERGIPVTSIPGCCAAVTALTLSGLNTSRFCFEGFLSTAKKSRKEHLESLVNEQRTMIFYEAPHKLVATLESMAEVFGGDRPISLCRELTKLHEEVIRTTLQGALELYAQQPPKGEFVLVVAGAVPVEKESFTAGDAAARVAQLMEEGMSRKDAVKQTAKELDLPKNVVYDAALNIDN